MNMIEKMAEAIERHFVGGKWEISIIPEGHPTCTPGRWLDCGEANYSFRPIDLARDIISSMREPTLEMVEAGRVAARGLRNEVGVHAMDSELCEVAFPAMIDAALAGS